MNGLVLGLKWVPANAAWDTALGTVRLGLEGGVFWARATGERWNADVASLIALSSLEFAPTWNLYTNLVATRDLDTGKHVNGLRLALAWQPDERVLLFVESWRANDSSNLRNAEFRLWAIPEVLGLDVVTTRLANGGLTFGAGFGWYGIRLP